MQTWACRFTAWHREHIPILLAIRAPTSRTSISATARQCTAEDSGFPVYSDHGRKVTSAWQELKLTIGGGVEEVASPGFLIKGDILNVIWGGAGG